MTNDADPYSAVTAPRPRRLSDSITEYIEHLIAAGRVTPGQALPPERELAKKLAVSRPSLREALLMLEGRGLIQSRRGGGYGITDVTGPTITDPLVHLLQRHPSAASDVLELRHGLECVAAYFAAIRAGDKDARRLREMAAAMKRRTRRDPMEDAELDVEFHMAVAEASCNVALVHVMRGLFNLMRSNMIRSREVLYRQSENVILLDEQHVQIVKAIVARDHNAARQAANLHLSFIQVGLRESAGMPHPAAQRRIRASAVPARRTNR